MKDYTLLMLRQRFGRNIWEDLLISIPLLIKYYEKAGTPQSIKHKSKNSKCKSVPLIATLPDDAAISHYSIIDLIEHAEVQKQKQAISPWIIECYNKSIPIAEAAITEKYGDLGTCSRWQPIDTAILEKSLQQEGGQPSDKHRRNNKRTKQISKNSK